MAEGEGQAVKIAIALIAACGLSACGTVAKHVEVQRVNVAVPVACQEKEPDRPVMPTESLADTYQRILGWSLRHKLVTLAMAFGVFVLSIVLVPVLGTEFVPKADYSETNVNFYTPVGSSIEATQAKARRIEPREPPTRVTADGKANVVTEIDVLQCRAEWRAVARTAPVFVEAFAAKRPGLLRMCVRPRRKERCAERGAKEEKASAHTRLKLRGDAF